MPRTVTTTTTTTTTRAKITGAELAARLSNSAKGAAANNSQAIIRAGVFAYVVASLVNFVTIDLGSRTKVANFVILALLLPTALWTYWFNVHLSTYPITRLRNFAYRIFFAAHLVPTYLAISLMYRATGPIGAILTACAIGCEIWWNEGRINRGLIAYVSLINAN